MGCPHYHKPAKNELIGRCNGYASNIPSETHQNCLCTSESGLYIRLCPVYRKIQHERQKQGIFRRIFPIYRKHAYNPKLESENLAIAKETQ
jgi:hypothetical protein